jgi:hypothetical protein
MISMDEAASAKQPLRSARTMALLGRIRKLGSPATHVVF